MLNGIGESTPPCLAPFDSSKCLTPFDSYSI